jgi:hypothetical protein
MNKLTLLLLTIIMTSKVLYSQDDYTEDVIYLKNGSIIRGTLVEQIPNKSYKLETSDGSIFVYEVEEILKITKEVKKIVSKKQNKYSNSTVESKTSGYKGYVDGVLGFGLNGGSLIGLQMVNGVLISPNFFLGLGVAVDRYNTNAQFNMLPIFVDCKYYFNNANFSPFLNAAGGYSPSISSGNSGGVYINPSIGVKIAIPNSKSDFNISFGLKYQQNSYLQRYGFSYYSADGSGSIFHFKIGASF